MFLEQVADTIRKVATVEVVERFNSLTADEIIEKSPGDLVTIADRECERILGNELRKLRDVPVVGEESSAVDPTINDQIDEAPAVWIIDPVDGTKNFVKGDPNFAVMVAYVEAGRCEAAWIWQPIPDLMYTAARGSGVLCNGQPVIRTSNDEPTGIIKRGYMGKQTRDRLGKPPVELATEVQAVSCAGVEYIMLVEGTIDFLFYYRTNSWDHAPGALIAEEIGMHVARLDDTEYRSGDGRDGLLSATPALWASIASHINAALDPA